MIWNNIHELDSYLQNSNFKINNGKIYMTSGGFDPMHVGHLRCIQETVKLAAGEKNSIVVIVVNGDGFLLRKKGYAFMPLQERMEIIAGIEGVDDVTTWDDGTTTVIGAIEILAPDYFTKGGDRTDTSNVPEFKICQKIGCQILFGIGGEKIQSSSNLVQKMTNQNEGD